MSESAAKKVFVFTGPTLSAEDGRAELAASYLPPVSQGDVYTVARRRPWGIGIIDGYFERMPSVWHKEILWAMAQGVHVFGSASMGALRAAELAAFGMQGVGAVFEAFHSGELEDDDEVAVIHGPAEADYVQLSEAMVDIRFTLAAAREAGVICQSLCRDLVTLAKGLFYPERSYERLLNLARDRDLPAGPLADLTAWLPGGRVDQKRTDARAMLSSMACTLAENPGPKQVRFTFQQSAFWRDLRSSVERRPLDHSLGAETHQPDALLEELKLSGEVYEHERERAIARLLALEVAQERGIEATEEATDETVRDLRRRLGLEEPDQLRRWRAAQRIGRKPFTALMRQEARVQRMRQLAESHLEMYFRDQLRLAGRYGELEDRSREKQRRLASRGLESPVLADTGLDEEQLWQWYFGERLEQSIPADLTDYARRMDFSDLSAMRRAVVREYLFLQLAAKMPAAVEASDGEV